MIPDWEALYQEGDTGWDRGEASPALQKWLDKGVFADVESVLIPGCGRGYEVVELAKRGFEVTALDLAPTAMKHLEQELNRSSVQASTACVNIFEYDNSEAFDLVYEQTCLCAIGLAEREAYADAVYQWLKPKGKLLLSMMQTGEKDGPPFHCDWSDMRLLFTEEKWLWQEEPPFVISRGNKRISPRFELGFILIKKGNNDEMA